MFASYTLYKIMSSLLCRVQCKQTCPDLIVNFTLSLLSSLNSLGGDVFPLTELNVICGEQTSNAKYIDFN